jgi:hypothetical protein
MYDPSMINVDFPNADMSDGKRRIVKTVRRQNLKIPLYYDAVIQIKSS